MRFFRARGAKGERRVADVYLGLRKQILALTPDELGDAVDADTEVLALLMETGYETAVATLVGAADGSTSLYFSSGGGIIGAGEHAHVAEATHRWLGVCTRALDRLDAVIDATLPVEGVTQFVAVTRSGLRRGAAREIELVNYAHALAELFHAGQEVLAKVRVAEER